MLIHVSVVSVYLLLLPYFFWWIKIIKTGFTAATGKTVKASGVGDGLCRLCNAQGPGGKGALWGAYSGISAKKFDISKLVDIFVQEKAHKRTF